MAKSPTISQWNSSAHWYDQNMGEAGDELNKEIIRPILLKIIGNLEGKHLLDIGCGSGYLTSELAKLAKRVVVQTFLRIS